MIFNMLKFHSHFIAKKCLLGAFYCRMEPMLFQDLLYRFYWACHFRSANFKEFEGILRNFKEH